MSSSTPVPFKMEKPKLSADLLATHKRDLALQKKCDKDAAKLLTDKGNPEDELAFMNARNVIQKMCYEEDDVDLSDF